MTAGKAGRLGPGRPAGPEAAWPRIAWPGIALVLTGLVVVLLAAGLVPLVIITRQNALTSISQMLAITVPFAAVGAVVARRQPGNQIGWLMLAVGGCFLLTTDAGLYNLAAYRLGHDLPAGPAGLLLVQAWELCLALMPLLILLFPGGRRLP